MTTHRSLHVTPIHPNHLARRKRLRKRWASRLGVDVSVLRWDHGRLFDLSDGRELCHEDGANLAAPKPELIPQDPRDDFVPSQKVARGPEPSHIPQRDREAATRTRRARRMAWEL